MKNGLILAVAITIFGVTNSFAESLPNGQLIALVNNNDAQVSSMDLSRYEIEFVFQNGKSETLNSTQLNLPGNPGASIVATAIYQQLLSQDHLYKMIIVGKDPNDWKVIDTGRTHSEMTMNAFAVMAMRNHPLVEKKVGLGEWLLNGDPNLYNLPDLTSYAPAAPVLTNGDPRHEDQVAKDIPPRVLSVPQLDPLVTAGTMSNL